MKTIWHWHLDLETASESNSSEHWTVKRKRHQKQKEQVKKAFLVEKPSIAIPCTVVLTRISPRALDEHDNLRTSLKWVVDAVADYILPGKAAGRADDCKEIKWEYKQVRGGVREYGVRIEIMSDT